LGHFWDHFEPNLAEYLKRQNDNLTKFDKMTLKLVHDQSIKKLKEKSSPSTMKDGKMEMGSFY